MMNKQEEMVLSHNIKLVQHLIERCLLVEMEPSEIADTLYKQVKIEPWFTEIVLEKLEEDNPGFFKEYYMKLEEKEEGRNILRSRL